MKVSTDEITAAARELFREHGYAGASMQDLAEAVGLKKASLYSRVSSKEQLVSEVLSLTLAETLADHRANAVTNWLLAYEGMLRGIASILSDRKRCVALHLAYGVSDATPVAKQAVREYFIRCRDALSEILSHAIDHNQAEAVATDALSLLEGATLWIAIIDDLAPMDRAVSNLLLQAHQFAPGLTTQST